MPGVSPNTIFIELLTMSLARSVLDENAVPETDTWQNCYRIRRFDRPRTSTGVKRLHQEDGYAQVAPMYDSLCTYHLRFRDDNSGWGGVTFHWHIPVS